MAEDETVPFWWVVLFLALALGAGAIAVTSVGGSLIDSTGVVLPLLF
ncbi:hypothetical protein [Haloprofundus salinisoli]|nr:hypothetical protein [Haloprofundus salinisoli]